MSGKTPGWLLTEMHKSAVEPGARAPSAAVVVRVLWSEIGPVLDAGFSVKRVWNLLSRENSMPLGIAAFRKAIAHHRAMLAATLSHPAQTRGPGLDRSPEDDVKPDVVTPATDEKITPNITSQMPGSGSRTYSAAAVRTPPAPAFDPVIGAVENDYPSEYFRPRTKEERAAGKEAAKQSRLARERAAQEAEKSEQEGASP